MLVRNQSLYSAEAVVNEKLPVMDEVERGFKEKYEDTRSEASQIVSLSWLHHVHNLGLES